MSLGCDQQSRYPLEKRNIAEKSCVLLSNESKENGPVTILERNLYTTIVYDCMHFKCWKFPFKTWLYASVFLYLKQWWLPLQQNIVITVCKVVKSSVICACQLHHESLLVTNCIVLFFCRLKGLEVIAKIKNKK